jgi:hypothetical protein
MFRREAAKEYRPQCKPWEKQVRNKQAPKERKKIPLERSPQFDVCAEGAFRDMDDTHFETSASRSPYRA